MSKKNLNRKTAEEALKYLDWHRLDPTPSNYHFAYLYVTGSNGWLRRTVDGITDGGVRLSQKDVDDLMEKAPGESGGGSAASVNAVLEQHQAHLRHQMLNFADIAARAVNDTGAFTKDLEESACKIGGHEELGDVVRVMIAKTNAMERKLAETRRETEKLKQDLDAARDDASRDSLTNLPNRRAIDRQLDAIARAGKALSVAFCDIDHFKLINDKYGHAVGDRVLKVVAETLAESMTPHTVGRFGGEEFVVVLPETEPQAAYDLIEKAREALSTRHFRVRDTDEPIGQVTFSAGIAMTDSDPQDALREADDRLYEAKRSGRNRTIFQITARPKAA
ncbi:MAG: GGDEF domain-containing protein [Sphingobium sp.]|nr:GGDEF domain-containing protein [Sphingobium sp.]